MGSVLGITRAYVILGLLDQTVMIQKLQVIDRGFISDFDW